MQDNDDLINSFEKYFIEYINSFKCNRSSLYSRALNAYLKDKSPTKKFCTLIAKEIIEDKNKYYTENYFFNISLRNNLIKIIYDAMKTDLEYPNFISELCKISKVIEFIYKISKSYSEIFHNNKNDILYDYFIRFLFRKKYDENLINKIGNLYGFTLNRIKFEDFIQKISSQYINENDILKEYIKIFLLNGKNEKVEIEKIFIELKAKIKDIGKLNYYESNNQKINITLIKEYNSSNKNGNNGKTLSTCYNETNINNESSKKSETINEKENSNSALKKELSFSNEIEKNDKNKSQYPFKYFSKILNISFISQRIQYLSWNIANILNNMKLNRKNIEDYYNLKYEITKNKILINKLSTSITFLLNPNIINLKRKIIEVMFFSFLQSNISDFAFSGPYFPKINHINELNNIMNNKINEVNSKEELDKINQDIKRFNEILNQENKNDDKTFVKIVNQKNFNNYLMVLEFLKFCRRHFNPIVHIDSNNINYYLLPKELLNDENDENNNIKYSDQIFSLNDFISKEEEKKNDNNSNVDNLQIYKENKTLTIEQALEILFSKKTPYLYEDYIPNLEAKNSEMKKKIIISNNVCEKFIKAFDAILDYKFFEDNKIEKTLDNELELSEELKKIDESITRNLNQDKKDNENELYILLDSLEKLITLEFKEANQSIYSTSQSMDKEEDFQKLEKIISSKINRIYLILLFVKKQNISFEKEQKMIYEEYLKVIEDFENITLKIKNLVNNKYSILKENLFDKWVSSVTNKSFKNANYNVLIKNIKALIPNAPLGINYSFDEKFVFWALKNDFAEYL